MLKNGNSPCSTFIWTNSKDFHETFIDTNELTFLMKEHHQGSYRCKCENEYGMSEESEEVEISFLNSTSLSKITFYIVEKLNIVVYKLYCILNYTKGCQNTLHVQSECSVQNMTKIFVIIKVFRDQAEVGSAPAWCKSFQTPIREKIW